MKCPWPTIGVPMACPGCSAAYPCHFSPKSEINIPYDVSLTINTNIQYNLDETMFPGLNSSNDEFTLMIAPVGEITIHTNQKYEKQTDQPVISNLLSSMDMQCCSSGYVSEEEEEIVYPNDEDLEVPGIGSFLEFLNNSLSLAQVKPTTPIKERSTEGTPVDFINKNGNNNKQQTFLSQNGDYPTRYNSRHQGQQFQDNKTNSLPRRLPIQVQDFHLNTSTKSNQFHPTHRKLSRSASFAPSSLKHQVPQDGGHPNSTPFYRQLSRQHWSFSQLGDTCYMTNSGTSNFTNNHTGDSYGDSLPRDFLMRHERSYNGHIPSLMQTGNSFNHERTNHSVNWGPTVSSAIHV